MVHGEPLDLAGTHALVAGATAPLHRALALGLAQAGASVSLFTMTRDKEEQPLAGSLLEEFCGVRMGKLMKVSLLQPAEVELAVDELEATVGPVEILVSAPRGSASQLNTLAMRRRDWSRQIEANATGVYVVTAAIGKRMLMRGHGRIMNVIMDPSVAAASADPGFAASQGAVLSYTRALRAEWADKGVSVDALVCDLEASTFESVVARMKALLAGE